jgi:hypothetical protein
MTYRIIEVGLLRHYISYNYKPLMLVFVGICGTV